MSDTLERGGETYVNIDYLKAAIEAARRRGPVVVTHDTMCSQINAAVDFAKRETARRCAEMLETEGVLLPIETPETKQDRCVRFARAFAQKIRDEFGLPASNPSPAVPGGEDSQ